ncbi:hypothetical protein ACFOOK_28035 [Micromonospora krabiensis]|uniref:Uncharacterized protein n=1 Tax=Micromonospora krabiensis TaxID=307121 RepID=A0A1C3N4S8_9ACTN|nr:hypothetical protein [Micromonospora krabiensis]SBV27581.1 hypothetical protein GA0070620_3105 [Micromonospora krabiensis]
MSWVVAPNIKALFASVNKLAPGRDKASDGTVGDLAHQSGTSGHNPDDTPGVSAERTDPDSIPEVRAGDIDKDLRHPTVTMEQVVQKVVKTPALRRRLIYVIYNRRIWSASSGWAQKAYTGSNPHDKHAHFSGHPDYDNDSSPWREIEALGDDDMDATERAALMEVRDQVRLFFSGMTKTATGTVLSPTVWRIRDEEWQAKVSALLTALSGQIGGLDTKQVIARIEALAAEDRQRDAELAELVRRTNSGELTAEQVVDELARRLAGNPQS